MKENFPNLVREIDMEVQEAQKVPNKMEAKWPTPRHIIIKMPKVKDRILKVAREKQRVTYKGVPIDFQLISPALAGIAQWTECRPVNQRVAGLIPSQDTCLGCGPGPW